MTRRDEVGEHADRQNPIEAPTPSHAPRHSPLGGRFRRVAALTSAASVTGVAYDLNRPYGIVDPYRSVMDGFVNEFETVRRGLHTREAEEMNARDSVVGHHMGLTNAHRTFTKSKGATSEEPVYELYRNGIVHGTLLDYDNDVLATKAWNRLFAVMDWAKAREREREPAKPQPTWREIFAQQLHSDSRGFANDPAVVSCGQYLAYWQRRNYGEMAKLTSHMVRSGYGRRLPAIVRQEYSAHVLTGYEILSVDHLAPAVCHINVQLVLDSGTEKRVNLRWIFEDEAGNPVASSLPGTWGLIVWGPAAFLSEAPE